MSGLPTSKHASPPDVSPGFWDQPRQVRRIITALAVACVIVAVADAFYTNPHPHFAVEKIPAFQAVFGFVAFVVIVMIGRMIRPIVSRDEAFYQQRDLPMPGVDADVEADHPEAHS